MLLFFTSPCTNIKYAFSFYSFLQSFLFFGLKKKAVCCKLQQISENRCLLNYNFFLILYLQF